MAMDDAQLIAVWLHGRPAATRKIYGQQARRLQASLGKPLAEASLEDLQRHADGLAHLAPRSQCLALSAIKSLYAFHCRVGTLKLNPSAALTLPRVANDLTERILTEDDVARLLGVPVPARERAMLHLLYVAGLRAAEICGLYWRSLKPREKGEGQVTVTGKGGKTRAILLPASMWAELAALRGQARPTDPVFPSVSDPTKPYSQRTLLRIVKRAAKAVDLTDKVSMHWLRHSHASHALDHGAPITLVRDTLGHASIATTDRYAHAKPNDGSARFLGEMHVPGGMHDAAD